MSAADVVGWIILCIFLCPAVIVCVARIYRDADQIRKKMEAKPVKELAAIYAKYDTNEWLPDELEAIREILRSRNIPLPNIKQAAPPLGREPQPVTAQPSLIPGGAGFGIRFLARFIDDLLYGAILLLISLFVAGIVIGVLAALGKLTPESQALLVAGDLPRLTQRLYERRFTGFGLSTLGATLYHTVAEGFSTVTIGKLICGLRVVQVDGRPASMKAALIRDLAFNLDVLFFGLIGYASMKKGPLRQRYGDVWGKTVVVKASVFQPQPARGFGRMFAGILMGSALWAGMLCLQWILKLI